MNDSKYSTIAPLTNVALAGAAMERVTNRPPHLPGMIVFYGPAGLGKTSGATYTANRNKAYYIMAKSGWTKKATLLAMLKEMGIKPMNTIYDMTDQVAEQLATSDKPLIIDELDHLINNKSIEIVRDIYESSGAAILMIAEETAPVTLRKWERFHSRVMDWVPAQPPTMQDAKQLLKLYCRDIEIKDDLLEHILKMSFPSVRRIVINLEKVRSDAADKGIDKIDLKSWGDKELFTGNAVPRKL